MVKFSKWPTLWKPIPERMTGNVVISDADVVNVCRTKQGRKARSLWGISWWP